MTFAFPKKQHLAQREAITALASHGKVLFHYPIKAFCLPAGRGTADAAGSAPTESTGGITPGYSRYVFTVPKKLFKRAVKRNLLKRRMREAVRLNQSAILGDFCADFLLVYIGKEICPYEAIEAAVKDILARGKEIAGSQDIPAGGKQMAEKQGLPEKGVKKDNPAREKQMTEGKGKPAKTESRS